MKTNKSILLILLAAFSNLYAEDLTDIQISAPVLNTQDLTNEAIEDINTKNAIDGGDLLRSINGISTIRRGGHGLDPVIRGQSDQRLNSSIDGAIVYGACSSKMDPASTYVNIENYDSITVIKGSQSVLYGAGGPGGVVRYERVTEPLSQANAYKFKIGQTFDSNAEAKTTIGDFTLGLGQAYFRINGSYSEAGNYETGTGLKPLTEYETSNYAAIIGKMSAISDYDYETWQKVLNVNITSSFLLTKYLLPIMEHSVNPRIIFTSSGVAEKGRAYWGAYAVSKAAVKSLAEILQEELEPVSKIKIFNFDPGKTKTSMRAFAYPAENPNDLKDAAMLLDDYLWMLSERSNGSKIRYIKFD